MYQCVGKLKRLSRVFVSGSLIICCAFLFSTQSEAASGTEDEDSIEVASTKVIRHKIDNNFRVRGWKLSTDVYFGNTKINGHWGLGILVDKGGYAYGLNNSQASFTWRF